MKGMKVTTKREIVAATLRRVCSIAVQVRNAEDNSANARRELDRLIDGLRRCAAPNATAEGEQDFVREARARDKEVSKLLKKGK